MTTFLDIYLNPLQGKTIHKFLSVKDEQALDSTCKEVRAFNRKHVYPSYSEIDTANFNSAFIRKINSHIKTLIVRDTRRSLFLNYMPVLEEITFVVPLVVDVTFRRIYEDTHVVWRDIAGFLQLLTVTPNKVHTVRIVPGDIKLIRIDVPTGDTLEEHTVQDSTEGSHLQLYRFYQFPPFISFFIPAIQSCKGMFKVNTFHYPSQLATRSGKNTLHNIISNYTTWDNNRTGLASMFYDLFI